MNAFAIGVLSKFADISMEHGVRRLAQQALALKKRVVTATPHLRALPGGERFRAFALENPGVLQRSQNLHQRMAALAGLRP